MLQKWRTGYIFSDSADDVALQYTNSQWQTICQDMNHDLKLLKNWCNNNRMIVNATKTKIINFDLIGFSFENILKFHARDVCYNSDADAIAPK